MQTVALIRILWVSSNAVVFLRFMCVVLGHIARLLEMLHHIFFMTSISGDTQIGPVPEVALLPPGTCRRGYSARHPHVSVEWSLLHPTSSRRGFSTVSNAQRGALSVARTLMAPFGLRAVRRPHTDGDCRTVPCCL